MDSRSRFEILSPPPQIMRIAAQYHLESRNALDSICLNGLLLVVESAESRRRKAGSPAEHFTEVRLITET